MKTYIALLRGINVSGKNLIKMAELKVLFTKIGLNDVTTYIQSGNVIFTSEENNTLKIETEIIKAIKTKFGYDLKVLVITKKLLKNIFSSNPFLADKNKVLSSLFVTFLHESPNKEGIPLLKNYTTKQEEFIVDNKIVYLHYPNGSGRSKLSNNLIESKLKSSATTRNWRTITKLLELSKP